MTMMDSYLDFVEGRFDIWKQRQTGHGSYFSDDPILATKKFTNVFRVLDFGSQFLLRELLNPAESREDVLFRSFLYRYTNRPEPWVWFHERHGRYPSFSDFESGLLLSEWQEYDRGKGVFFSSAYTMFSGGENPGVRRFEWAIGLAGQVGPLQDRFWSTTRTQARVKVLMELPRTAFFMGQQVTTDCAYWDPEATENDWVAPGPGSLRGASWLMGAAIPFEDVVELAQDALRALRPNVSLQLPDGRLRFPSLMDVQNTLCEFDKYNRWKSAILPNKPYKAKHPGKQPLPVLPKHW